MAAVKRLATLALAGLAACTGGLAVEDLQRPAGAEQASADPVLALDAATGDVVLSWVGRDSTGWHVWFARSTDRGGSWSAAVRVTRTPDDVHPHGESSPRLVVGPRGAVAIAWTNSVPAPGRLWPGSNIRFARSSDGGQTWSAALTLNDDTTAGPGGHIFHGAAWQGDSTLVVAWMDERGGPTTVDAAAPDHAGHHPEANAEPDATIYLAESRDFGRTWRPNRPLWGAACPCCRVSLARGPDGAVVAAWRKHFSGSVRDPVVAPVTDSPGLETRVATDNWVYPGCPHTGPGMTVDASGDTHVAWYVGKRGAAGVFYARATGGGGAAFGAPVALVSAPFVPTAHPRVAALADGAALVVSDIDARGRSALVVGRISTAGRLEGRRNVPNSTGADHPEIVALRDGTALLAWTQQAAEGASARIRLARVRP